MILMDENNNMNNDVPGKGAATGSLVCGIISVVIAWFGWGAIAGIVVGIIGLVMATNAKKAGFDSGMRTAGFVLSLIGLILSAVVFVSCVACTSAVGCARLS
ncbi:MAG: hypothetical protein LUB63_05350 [Oscillospiraceae bacterium]|nr:hypothetical protein [Oscillospiraceae bacterium]